MEACGVHCLTIDQRFPGGVESMKAVHVYFEEVKDRGMTGALVSWSPFMRQQSIQRVEEYVVSYLRIPPNSPILALHTRDTPCITGLGK